MDRAYGTNGKLQKGKDCYIKNQGYQVKGKTTIYDLPTFGIHYWTRMTEGREG